MREEINSADFSALVSDPEQLASFDPLELENREQRLAFWINLYNFLATRQADISGTGAVASIPASGDSSGLPGTDAVPGILASGAWVGNEAEFKEHPDRTACIVAGRQYWLNDIEHGILRGNARRPHRFWKRLRPWDSRRRQSLNPPEPSACFALLRSGQMDPASRFYREEKIEGQLHRAAVDYISKGGVLIDREREELSLAHPFRSLSRDFGGGQGVLLFILEHLEDPEDAAWIRSRAGKIKVRFREQALPLPAKSAW